MLRCTYIVLIHDNQYNIPILINSLKNINGNFGKEFIFVDDGSKDLSLSMLKSCAADLPRTTILTQGNLGPAISINKALGIATGDYIHFIEGDEKLHPRATAILLEACNALEVEVAFGKVATADSFQHELSSNYELVSMPVNKILEGKFPEIRNIGRSGSLVSRNLLETIGRADSSIYTQNISLSLRCAKHSKFAFVNNVLSIRANTAGGIDSKFEAYNNLKSVYNFIKHHRDIGDYLPFLLLMNLSNEVIDGGARINYRIKALLSKYLKLFSLDKILALYKAELDKLF